MCYHLCTTVSNHVDRLWRLIAQRTFLGGRYTSMGVAQTSHVGRGHQLPLPTPSLFPFPSSFTFLPPLPPSAPSFPPLPSPLFPSLPFLSVPSIPTIYLDRRLLTRHRLHVYQRGNVSTIYVLGLPCRP